MSMKISFSEVQAAQKVVADGVEQMNALTRQILAQAGLSQAAMQAPAGQITAETFGDLGGGGKALAEMLAQLHNDLNTLQQVAAEGSDQASRDARSGAVGSPVAAGM
jgi:flagellar hook-basal body complex protein FliE